jgi:hypothetical protein
VIVVDVGGATTDVYSVLTPEGEDAALARRWSLPLWRARTVEGDLGMRWGATGVVAAAPPSSSWTATPTRRLAPTPTR